MNGELYKQSMRQLVYQRNISFIFSIASSVSVILLSILLFWKSERVVVAPPFIHNEFWVESKHVSVTYLEQMGVFLGNLLLSKSSGSAPAQRDVLLRHTAPSYYSQLKKKLDQEAQKLIAENASYVFFPVTIEVHPDRKELVLTGDRKTYVGEKIISTSRESYILSFTIEGARVLLTGVRTLEDQ